MTSKFSLAFEHDGENIAVSIETEIETQTLLGDDRVMKVTTVGADPADVIDRLARMAKQGVTDG
jgi:hypothetical protein